LHGTTQVSSSILLFFHCQNKFHLNESWTVSLFYFLVLEKQRIRKIYKRSVFFCNILENSLWKHPHSLWIYIPKGQLLSHFGYIPKVIQKLTFGRDWKLPKIDSWAYFGIRHTEKMNES